MATMAGAALILAAAPAHADSRQGTTLCGSNGLNVRQTTDHYGDMTHTYVDVTGASPLLRRTFWQVGGKHTSYGFTNSSWTAVGGTIKSHSVTCAR